MGQKSGGGGGGGLSPHLLKNGGGGGGGGGLSPHLLKNGGGGGGGSSPSRPHPQPPLINNYRPHPVKQEVSWETNNVLCLALLFLCSQTWNFVTL